MWGWGSWETLREGLYMCWLEHMVFLGMYVQCMRL